MITRLLAAALLLCLCAPVEARELPLPAAWHFMLSQPEDNAYTAGLTDLDSHGGKTCGFIKSGLGTPKGLGDVSQAFKADRYRGKRLRWSLWYKSIALKGKVTLWMRVDGPNHTVLSYGRYVPTKTATGWRAHSDEFNIPKAAEQIAIGVTLEGEGVVCFDDMQFAVIKGIPGEPVHAQKNGFEE
ncbi:MAG: AraC family transcriptional regulator [Cyanobacteria bacterium RYN_339]|nr:AraC family transcriptional regulator [Cyanobacteria bacterium RYN_339]